MSTEQMTEGGLAIIYQVVGLLEKVVTVNNRSRKPKSSLINLVAHREIMDILEGSHA